MITIFRKYKKINENYELTIKLVDYLSDEFIEEYYEDNYSYNDIEEILDIWPSMAWDHMDDDKYIEDYIEEEKQREIDDFGDDDDFRRYINNNLTDKKIKLVLKKYNKKTNEQETEYSDYMLDELSEKQLRNIIKKDGKEEDFVSELAEKRGGEYYDAKSIIEDIYGNIEHMSGKEVYDWIKWYIDDDSLIKAYKDNESLDDKKEYISENISDNKEIQEKILEENEDSVIELAELFSTKRKNRNEQYDDDIGNEYEFQKLYIQKFVKDNGDVDSTAKALKYLYDEFGLDEDIAEEHEGPDMVLIDASKYNM